MEWNQIALAATVTAAQGPVPQARSMTIVQVAVHDAVNSITGKHGTYGAYGPAPAGASPEAAAIAAAHTMLMSLFPSQSGTFNPARAASLAARGLTEADPGIGGRRRASRPRLFAARANDGASLAQFPYVAPGSGTPGVWVTIGTAAALLPGWGNVAPWVIHSGSQFRPDAPPALDSGRWARDYNEVKVIGKTTAPRARRRRPRSAGSGWARRRRSGTAPRAAVIDARGLDISDTARTFALMYRRGRRRQHRLLGREVRLQLLAAAGGDSQRPPRRQRQDRGRSTWTPLFPTPPHPEYISGHSTNSSAMANMLAFLFGDNPGVTIIATSPTNPGFPRQWTAFSEGIDEVIEARIYSGIHYRTADEVGARVGRQVARFVLNHALR